MKEQGSRDVYVTLKAELSCVLRPPINVNFWPVLILLKSCSNWSNGLPASAGPSHPIYSHCLQSLFAQRRLWC